MPPRAVATRSPLSRRGPAKPPGALVPDARDLEPRAEVAADADEGETIQALSDRGWLAAMRWACETAEGLPGPDGTRPTNLDRYNAATFLAKVRGEYAPAKLAVKAEEETRVVVAFAALCGPVAGEDDAPAPPHVLPPDGAHEDDAVARGPGRSPLEESCSSAGSGRVSRRITSAAWWLSGPPSSEEELAIWSGRAALLDALYYRDH